MTTTFEAGLLAAVHEPMWEVTRAVIVDPMKVPLKATALCGRLERLIGILHERREQGLHDGNITDSLAEMHTVARRCAEHGLGATGAGDLASAFRRFSASVEDRLTMRTFERGRG